MSCSCDPTPPIGIRHAREHRLEVAVAWQDPGAHAAYRVPECAYLTTPPQALHPEGRSRSAVRNGTNGTPWGPDSEMLLERWIASFPATPSDSPLVAGRVPLAGTSGDRRPPGAST